MAETDRLREKQFGREIEFCAIVNAKSGCCAMDCRFCAQSIFHEMPIDSYPLRAPETLIAKTTSKWKLGIHRVGWVSSGCAAGADDVVAIAKAAGQCRGDRLCASLGQLDSDALTRLKAAGITRYHHNLETSERFYPSICTTQQWKDRVATVRRAKSLGFEVCCGGLFGLGETWKDRMELACVLRELEVDSVPLNFFHAIPGTPLAHQAPLSPEEGLRIIALFRLVLPGSSIRLCGGRPKLFGARTPETFYAGADALMTGDYLTTHGISPETDRVMTIRHGFRPSSANH